MSNVLVISYGLYPPAWYRCGLPANELGWDWAGVLGEPNVDDGLFVGGGNIEKSPQYDSYEVIILQMRKGHNWKKWIEERQANGVKIIYEIDDFVHGIHKIADHVNKSEFGKKYNHEFNMCMASCDGIITSTDFLGEQYKKYNDNIHTCRNSIDTKRYDIERPDRGDYINIGWAGGSGHDQAFKKWYQAIDNVLFAYSNVSFVSIGERYGDIFKIKYPNRSISIPWVSIENVPYALANIDIALAPSHDSKYFKSKSDLRWLEASACGIPTICDPITYLDVIDGGTGIIAPNSDKLEDALYDLIEDSEERLDLGDTAQAYVKSNRDISVGSVAWLQTVSTFLE